MNPILDRLTRGSAVTACVGGAVALAGCRSPPAEALVLLHLRLTDDVAVTTRIVLSASGTSGASPRTIVLSDGLRKVDVGYYVPGIAAAITINAQALSSEDCVTGEGMTSVEVQPRTVSAPVDLVIARSRNPVPCAVVRDASAASDVVDALLTDDRLDALSSDSQIILAGDAASSDNRSDGSGADLTSDTASAHDAAIDGSAACIEGAKRTCSSDGQRGNCGKGTESCVAGVWGACDIVPAAADTCDPDDDANCNGRPNDGCLCVTGAVVQSCGPCDDGELICTDGNAGTYECRGGNHPTTYYRDADNDGSGDPSTSLTVCGSAPPGYLTIGDDCCDIDRNAHPRQTTLFYSVNACGSWDYDCDGVETGPALGVQFETCVKGGGGCVGNGWDRNAGVPACGGFGAMIICLLEDQPTCHSSVYRTQQGCN